MERPLKFSIIIPTYNYAVYLPDAINSVLEQDYPDTEILVIDDASTDATTDIANSFGGRIRYHKLEKNLGAAGAWDYGLRQARGEYLCKLDADDQQMPGFLAAADQALALDQSIGLVASSVMLKMNDHRMLVQKNITDRDVTLGADEFRDRFLHEFFIRMPGVCIRKSITAGPGGPDHKLYQIHDWEYLLRVTRGYKARLIARPLAVYRIHDSSITRTARSGRLFENDCVRWLDKTMQRGNSYMEERERNVLAGSLAILMMRSMKYPYTPGAFVRYLAARKIAAAGGDNAIERLNLYLARKGHEILWRNLQKLLFLPIRTAKWLNWRIRRAGELFRKGGYGAGIRFIREEAMNTRTFLTRHKQIDAACVRVECNICGWKGKRFNTHCGAGYVVYGCICPSCGSFPRHRGLAYIVDKYLKAELGRINFRDGARLLFAPERAVYNYLMPYINNLIGIDAAAINDLVSVRGDIQKIPFHDDAVCFISCFHVIEHVPDDRAALAELYRILAPDGRAMVCVPIKFNSMHTIEFGQPNPLREDHYYDYGLDFGDRLIAAKFRGVAYRLSKSMPPALFARLSLQDELIFSLQKAGGGLQPSICDHEGHILYGQ